MKQLTEIRAINNFVRDALHNGLDITVIESVDAAINRFVGEYETSPEILLLLVQRMNTLTLFEQFKKNDHQQVYPTLSLLDPKQVLMRHGYPDIFETVIRRYEERRQLRQNLPKEARMLDLPQVQELEKAAGAAGENVKNAFANDPRVKHAKRVDTLKKSAAIVRLAEVYWNTPGLETFIKTSGLDKNPGMKALLDEIRTLRTSKGVTKQANLDLFLNFKSALEALK